MRLDTANRAFLALAGVSLTAYLLGGLASCALLGLIAYRVSTGGLDALTAAGGDLRPAFVFLALSGAGTAAGLWSLRAQLAATDGLARRVGALRLAPPPELVAATDRTRLSGRVDLVDAAEPFSFAYGFLRPRVAISRGLVAAASPRELDAVLEHERYHVRNFDPLKVLIARVLPRALFYVPLLRDLRTRYIAGRELAADRRSLQAHGRVPLAGVLSKVVGGPGWAELGAAAAIGGPDLLEARVAQLETGREPPVSGISRTAALVSTGVVGLFAWSVVASDLRGAFTAQHATIQSEIPTWMHATGIALCSAGGIVLAWLGYRGLRRKRTGPKGRRPASAGRA